MHLPLTPKPCVLPRRETDFDAYAPLAFDAMGCRFEVLIDVERSSMDRGDCVAVCEDIRDLVLDWHHRLSVFEPSSIVSLINSADQGVALRVDDDMFALLSLCEQLRDLTDGAFNIAAGTLMKAHGFRDEAVDDLDGLDLDHAFVLDPVHRTFTKSDSRVSLDFGAIGKGFVLDLVRLELEELGISHAFVHGGTSSVLGMGCSLDDQAWTVRIDDGLDVKLNDLSIGVSEMDGRIVESQDERTGHLMDPATMKPASSELSRVVCVHQSAAIADAYSTACSVSPSLIDRLGDESCTLVALRADDEPTLHDPLGVCVSRVEECDE